jgi:hypothetical protein
MPLLAKTIGGETLTALGPQNIEYLLVEETDAAG